MEVAGVNVPTCHDWSSRQGPGFTSGCLSSGSYLFSNNPVTVTLRKIYNLDESLNSPLKVKLVDLLIPSVMSTMI